MKKLAISLAAFVGALAFVGAAEAEQAVLPTSSPLPWSDPAHNSPLEQYASRFATDVAERPARVHCHSEAEWAARGFPSGALGLVGYSYNPYTGIIVATDDIAHLREAVCGWLQLFATQGQKATRCATTETVERTVWDTVRVKKKVWYWQKVNVKGGKTKRVRKSKYIWVTKQVPRTVGEQVPGPRVPCYGSAEPMPSDYRNYALALEVLAHESIHLFDERVGYHVQTQHSAESRAECYGMQLLPLLAQSFGADEDDARAIGKYYWDVEYPKWGTGSPYWRADCQPNSALDITPNDGFWPRPGSLSRKAAPTTANTSLGSLAWGYRS